MRSIRWSVAAAGIAALAICGCYTGPSAGGPSKSAFVINDFKSRQPVEVAILPLTIAAPSFPRAGDAKLRAHLYRALIAKGYSPLALDYVDGRVSGLFGGRSADPPVPIDALRSSLDADGFLLVEVQKSESGASAKGGGWRLAAQVKLLEARTGTTLFDQTATTTLDVSADSNGNVSDRDLDDAMQRFASQLVVRLPNKT